MPLSVLIAGCGRLGSLLALKLNNQFHCIGLRRQIAYLPHGVEGIGADLCHADSLPNIPSVDHVIYCPADRKCAPKALYAQGLKNLLNAFTEKPKKLWLISSTSVYEENEGAPIDEYSATNPASPLLDMEKIGLDSGINTTILRPSGIYGWQYSHIYRWLANGTYPLPPQHYCNRIHIEDVAAAITHLMQYPECNTLYNLSDNSPCTIQALMQHAAATLHIPSPVSSSNSATLHGKRANSTKLLQTGFALLHPDCLTGYTPLLEGWHSLSQVSTFRKSIYDACCAIPAGKVVSYQQLARAVGRPKAARAVGQAMANNPCPPHVPCHRVVNARFQLYGFSQSTDNTALRTKYNRLTDEGVVIKFEQHLANAVVPPENRWSFFT